MPTSRSTIVSLLFFGSPIAVFWGIRTVVISTFYTVFVTWTAAHIGKKIGVIVPAWIDRYASAAVVLILSAKDIAASTAKRAPRYPFWRLVSFSVFGFGLCNMFSASASARARSLVLRCVAKATWVLPHSQRHSQLAWIPFIPAKEITVRRPKRRPVISIGLDMSGLGQGCLRQVTVGRFNA